MYTVTYTKWYYISLLQKCLIHVSVTAWFIDLFLRTWCACRLFSILCFMDFRKRKFRIPSERWDKVKWVLNLASVNRRFLLYKNKQKASKVVNLPSVYLWCSCSVRAVRFTQSGDPSVSDLHSGLWMRNRTEIYYLDTGVIAGLLYCVLLVLVKTVAAVTPVRNVCAVVFVARVCDTCRCLIMSFIYCCQVKLSCQSNSTRSDGCAVTVFFNAVSQDVCWTGMVTQLYFLFLLHMRPLFHAAQLLLFFFSDSVSLL